MLPDTPRCWGSSKDDHKSSKRGWWPNSWKSHPFLQIPGIFLLLISLWNYSPLQKLTTPNRSTSFAFQDGSHSVHEGCFLPEWTFFLFSSDWIFSNMKPRTHAWDVTILSCPTLFPAIISFLFLPYLLSLSSFFCFSYFSLEFPLFMRPKQPKFYI